MRSTEVLDVFNALRPGLIFIKSTVLEELQYSATLTGSVTRLRYGEKINIQVVLYSSLHFCDALQ